MFKYLLVFAAIIFAAPYINAQTAAPLLIGRVTINQIIAGREVSAKLQ